MAGLHLPIRRSGSRLVLESLTTTLFVVVILAVVPWGHVVRQYVMAPGDRWR